MILFWIICAALLLAAMALIGLPLWRRATPDHEVLRDAANLEILRDQTTELAKDLGNDLLTQESFKQGEHELRVRLLEEVKVDVPAQATDKPAKVLALVLVVLIPLLSLLIYFKLGSPQALRPQQVEVGADGSGIVRSEAALQEIEAGLKKFPANPDAWLKLGRSYRELNRFADAERAYSHLVTLVPDASQVWTEYADAYALNHGQTLRGEPTKFLDKALELDGKNVMALALSGSAAMERGDYQAAIVHWQKMLSILPADFQDAQIIRDGIKQAHEFLIMQKNGKNMPVASLKDKAPEAVVANQATAITGKISLSPALLGKAAPGDTVYILARAAEGPKIPLAVLRKQVQDLPVEFVLDDSMAMQPQLKISSFEKVIVVARISKSGSPMAQPGDMEGMTPSIKPGSKGISVVIDSAVK